MSATVVTAVPPPPPFATKEGEMVQRVVAEERKGINRIARGSVRCDSSHQGCHVRPLTVAVIRSSLKDPAAPGRRRPARGIR